MIIREATIQDAPLLAQVVIWGIGEEIADDFAGEKHTRDDVRALFTSLARREDAQYSYLNALVAETDEGKVMGAIIGYDGARLYDLRKAFFEEAARRLGYHPDGQIADETSPDEYYLDSLAVKPQYRGRGVASALLKAMSLKAAQTGKPAGLLVDKTNPKARRLYEHTGFKYVGDRPFAGVMMDHLQLPTDTSAS